MKELCPVGGRGACRGRPPESANDLYDQLSKNLPTVEPVGFSNHNFLQVTCQ